MTMKVFYGSLLSKATLVIMSVLVVAAGAVLIPSPAAAQEGAAKVEAAAPAQATGVGQGMKYMAAAIAVGLGSIGAGIAVAMVGSAAMGTVAERPELMGRSLIYVGLAEGIAIYGMVIAILILVT